MPRHHLGIFIAYALLAGCGGGNAATSAPVSADASNAVAAPTAAFIQDTTTAVTAPAESAVANPVATVTTMVGTLVGDAPPSSNFDLSHWYLTLPSGDTVSTDALDSGYVSPGEFFTDPVTGGMVFHCPNLAGTTTNSHYSRTELREMLAPGYSTTAAINNWTTADGGTLTATLRVDHVSTTGDAAKVGRVVIGQIHGPTSEPIRLYFDQAPDEAKGRIYAGHDDVNDNGSFSRDIVPNTNGEGIALGETFTYTIRLVDIHLTVTIQTASGAAYLYTYDIDPGYRGLNLYFKAGVYNQNNTGTTDDYVQATFFALTHTHP